MTDFWKNLTKPITVLAPMDDVTDIVFREIITETAKPDVLYTEFTSIDGLLSLGHDRVAQRLLYTQKQRPIVAQLWGNDPNKFEKAAKYIQEAGFDGIDINMGCPVRSVMKKSSGAALINNEELTIQIISAVKQGAPDIPLSVKTRLSENKQLTERWLSFLLNQNISAFILHGRTAKQLSKVAADWEEIKNAVNLRDKLNPNITLIGNGDVKSYNDMVNKQKAYKVDGVMVGRGIFENPWLFEKSETKHTIQEYLNLLIRHTTLFNEKWGKTKNYEVMKKFFKIYVKNFNGADNLRKQLMETRNYTQALTIVDHYLKEHE